MALESACYALPSCRFGQDRFSAARSCNRDFRFCAQRQAKIVRPKYVLDMLLRPGHLRRHYFWRRSTFGIDAERSLAPAGRLPVRRAAFDGRRLWLWVVDILISRPSMERHVAAV